jgi:hypothetical protein
LANAKKDLEEHIHRAEGKGFHCIYARIDSFVVESGALPLFEAEIGGEMGQLKIEAMTTKGVSVPSGNAAPTFLE